MEQIFNKERVSASLSASWLSVLTRTRDPDVPKAKLMIKTPELRKTALKLATRIGKKHKVTFQPMAIKAIVDAAESYQRAFLDASKRLAQSEQKLDPGPVSYQWPPESQGSQ